MSRPLRTWILGLFIVLGGMLALASPQLPPPRSVDSVEGGWEEPEGDPIERARYWEKRRGSSPAAEIVRAQDRARRLPQAKALPRTSGLLGETGDKAVAPGGSPWVSFGPTPIGIAGSTYSGRVRTIAVDPTNSNVVYAGAANGGVWKSTNGGASWTPMSNEGSQPTLAMGSIAVDPNNPNVIYAGTGEPRIRGVGRGILKSTNAGASWTLLGEGNPFVSGATTTYRLLVSPSSVVWVASSAGLIRSTNGTTFSRVTAVPNVTAMDVAMSSDGTVLYAAMVGNGIYRSRDGGATWALVTSGLPAASVWNGHRVRLAIAPSAKEVAYLLLDPAAGQIWVTTNTGSTWTTTASDTAAGSTQEGYNLEIAVHPLDPNVVYVGTINLTATTGGTTGGGWTSLGGGFHADQHAIVFPRCTVAPCPFYLGNDGGVYRMVAQPGNPLGLTAENKNTNLSITEFTGGDLGINFIDDPRAIGGSQDNGTEIYVRNDPPNPANPLEWTAAAEIFADGGEAFLVHDPASRHVTYGTRQGSVGGPSRSDFWGYSQWTHLTSGLAGQALEFYPAYDLDRGDHQHLAIAAGRQVHEILAPQASWSPSSQDLGSLPTAVAIAPGDGKVIYAGVLGGKVYRKTSGQLGGFSNYALRNGGLPCDLRVNAFAIDSANPDVVYLAGVPGGSCSPTAGAKAVFRTTNGGVNWTNVSGNLPATLPIYSIVTYFAGATRVLVLGTEAGVYFSTNDGQLWQAFNSGLPNIAVVRLALDRDRTTIAAFTPGRGAFSTNIGGGATCTYSITPSSQSFPSSGGTGSVGVTAPAGCAWSATSGAPFLSVTSGASGNGNGTVGYSVAMNAGSARNGTLTIAGQTFTVNQSGPAAPGGSLRGEYFTNPDLTGAPFLTRNEGPIDFSWGSGSPAPGTIAIDNFSVRWAGRITAQKSETYTFWTFSDDGVRLWVDGQLLLDRWFDQYGPEAASTSIALQAGRSYDIRLEYYERWAGAEVHLSWSSPTTPKQIVPAAQLSPVSTGTGLAGSYFTNPDLTGSPVLTRTEGPIDFLWGSGSPAPGTVAIDNVSVRWTGRLLAERSETYTFWTFSDDGVRLRVNGVLLLDRWFDQYGPEAASTSIALQAGRSYDITLEYYERWAGAEVHLSWSSPSTPKQIVPVSRLFPQ